MILLCCFDERQKGSLDNNIVYCFKFDFIKYGYIEQTYLVPINKIKIESKEQKEWKILKNISRRICGN